MMANLPRVGPKVEVDVLNEGKQWVDLGRVFEIFDTVVNGVTYRRLWGDLGQLNIITSATVEQILGVET